MNLFSRKGVIPQLPQLETVPAEFPYFEISDIQHGTQTWFNWRKCVIGASEADVIVGENRWQSRENLIQEKWGCVKAFSLSRQLRVAFRQN
jgi:hypothetical protein